MIAVYDVVYIVVAMIDVYDVVCDIVYDVVIVCLFYTSDAAVDLKRVHFGESNCTHYKIQWTQR